MNLLDKGSPFIVELFSSALGIVSGMTIIVICNSLDTNLFITNEKVISGIDFIF